jgi:hypothetical protein
MARAAGYKSRHIRVIIYFYLRPRGQALWPFLYCGDFIDKYMRLLTIAVPEYCE